MKTLGYAQKANGSVEAIVNQADNTVAVVQVGDAYDVSGDKFTVARISPKAVELVAAAVPAGGAPAAAQSASNLNSGSRPGSEVLTAPTGQVKQARATSLLRADGGYSKVWQNREVVPRHADPQIPAEPDFTRSKSFTSQLDSRQTNPANSSEGGKPIRSVRVNSAVATSSGPVGLARPMPGGTKGESALAPSKTLGFVERVDGKTEAILDEGGGVRLVEVRDPNRDTLMGKSESAQSTKPADAQSERLVQVPVRSSDQGSGTSASSAGSQRILVSAPDGARLSRASPALIADGSTGKDVAGAGRSRLPPETGSPPWSLISGGEGVERADGKVQAVQDSVESWRSVPSREGEPNTLAASGEDAAPAALAEVPSVRGLPAATLTQSFNLGDEQMADQLGRAPRLFGPDPKLTLDYWNHKQPETEELSEPGRPPAKPPPKLDLSVGPENVESGTAPDEALSPLLMKSDAGASAASETNAEDSARVRSIGYVEWQDGRSLTVVDDGDGGVRLIHEGNAHHGEIVGDRSSVVTAGPESIEIAELPITLLAPGDLKAPYIRSDAEGAHAPELNARPADADELSITQQPTNAIPDKGVNRRAREKQSSPRAGACLKGKKRPAILERSSELHQSPDNQKDAESAGDSRIKLCGDWLFHPGAALGACAAFADSAGTDRKSGMSHGLFRRAGK